MDKIRRARCVVSLLMGETSVAEAALAHDTTEEEILSWKALYLAGAKHAVARPVAGRVQRQGLWLLAPVAAFASLLGFVGHARSQGAGCAQTLPAPLTTFCPGTPATASSMNGNFRQMITWLEAKVGSVSAAGVTTSTVSAASVSAPTMNATNVNAAVVNATRLNAGGYTPPYTGWATQGEGAGGAGIYNDAGTYRTFMIVGNSSAGGARRVGLWDDVTVNGQLYAQGLHGPLGATCSWRKATYSNSTSGQDDENWNQPNGAWAHYGIDGRYHIAECNGGEYMAGWSCYASNYLDGNCRIKCCTP